MERRSLLDEDDAAPEENVNVFDDAFEVDEDVDMVADGFRPERNGTAEGGERQGLPSSSADTASSQPNQTPSAGPSRSSTRKSRSQENPFASPEDTDAEPLLSQTSAAGSASLAHRSVSSASSNQFARTNSQRTGAGGPSHPYGMYPQGTLARTESVATTSTVRPQGPSTPRSGPQHPYSLYPQGVGDELDDEHEAVQDSVPIGFPGLGQSFQRQRGPDGEEQDIVGYYGHAEQLPPYSRYPEDGPEKAPLLPPVPAPPTATHSHAPVLGSDPAMPLMHEQLQPPHQSMTDLSELDRQPSTASRNVATRDGAESTQDSEASDKTWSEKSWKEKRKTRVCGVPCWWYLVAVGVLAFILALIGGSVGGFVAGQQKAEQKLDKIATTTGYDASIISAPASTAPVPTGTFALDLGIPHDSQSECLAIPQQRPAWDCNLVYGNEVVIHVSRPHDGKQIGANVQFRSNGDENGLTYGSQAYQMNTTFSPFIWVQDTGDTTQEPALYFKSQYDKIVIIPENAVEIGSNKMKRDLPYEDQPAPSGAQPWLCFWNDTLLEGFIYPQQQIRPLPSYSATTTEKPYSTPSWYATITAAPSQTITTTLTMSTTTAKFTGPASAFPKWLYESYPNFNMTSYATAYPSKRKRDNDDNSNDGYPVYPYRVKLEERRLPGSPLPYCIQYQVLNDGSINWVPNASGQQIVVQLSERDPPFKPVLYPGQSADAQKVRRKRDELLGSCHCQWGSGAS